jgi:glutathionyl-hydroquinone reductase
MTLPTNEYLVTLKDKIEKMTKNQQLDILRILKKNQAIKLNENKSGIFVNISFLPQDVITDLDKYVKYVYDQENEFNVLENQKQEFKNTFFSGMAIGGFE